MRLLGKLRSSTPEPLFSNVLTPDRIPEFCIPPRLPGHGPPESLPSAAAVIRRCAAEPDLWPCTADEGAGHTDWDPRSQAALSLLHLPRARTAYGFCTLLESPHIRRKESLFLGRQRAAALRPRAHTYGGDGSGSGGGEGAEGAPVVPLRNPRVSSAALASFPDGCHPPRDALPLRLRGRRFLGAPEGLLSRALRARKNPGPARARSVSSGDEDEGRDPDAGPPAPARTSVSPLPGSQPQCLEAEGTVTLGRAGCALRLAAKYCPGSGHLRIRLLPAEGQAGGILEPRSISCRISLVLHSPDSTRKQRRAVLGQSRKAGLDQDFCFDGLTEEQVRRLAVRIKAENKGRGLERGRRLGQGELLLGSLLLL
ncbi:C2 calcium-dependent domain-containing protein 4A [Ochotona princeps]|uniref:C2 calcium-dependent domain-containing protein 4A n=1 Tax=Ochotona princeps TaxID=9978 RepID=UPI00271537F4|nr:C2 calcium-dependent domain-containing protein 4A [Ochotona princeps]